MKRNIKIFFIFAFSLFALSLFAPESATQEKAETAGQKFKSIRVLNEMPADQLGKVMNMMSASLGVNCAFCHASNDGDFEKEGFEHKDITRQMLKMTFDLNKNYFDGKQEISCATCHQGKPMPSSNVPLMPIAREKRLAQPSAKFSVEAILSKYENALGGRANLLKITSRRIKARRVEPDGKTFESEEILQKGIKISVKTVYPSKEYGDYTVLEIFDGKNAFKFGNGAPIDLKTDETAQIRREAQIFANADLRATYPNLSFATVEKIDGREVYVLSPPPLENIREKLYFDAETGLLVRRVALTPTVLGDFEYRADYTEYKNFGGVKLPTVIKFAVPNIRWTREILKVKNNANVADAAFER